MEMLNELELTQLNSISGGTTADGVAFGSGVALVGVTVAACGGPVTLIVVGAFIIGEAIFSR